MLLGDQLAVAATVPGRRRGDRAVVVLVAGPTAATGVDLVVDDETFPVVVPVALAADGPTARREFGGECRPSANHRVPPRPGVAVPPASHSGSVDGRGTLRRVGRRDQYRTELSALPAARWPGGDLHPRHPLPDRPARRRPRGCRGPRATPGAGLLLERRGRGRPGRRTAGVPRTGRVRRRGRGLDRPGEQPEGPVGDAALIDTGGDHAEAHL